MHLFNIQNIIILNIWLLIIFKIREREEQTHFKNVHSTQEKVQNANQVKCHSGNKT